MLKWLVSLCQFSLCYCIRSVIWRYRSAMKTRRSFFDVVILALMMIFLNALVSQANKKPVNLNTATALELQQVSVIGPSTADKILKCTGRMASSKAWTICARSKALRRSDRKNAQVRNCRQIPCREGAGELRGYLVSAAIYCQVAAARFAKHHGAKSADAELKREPTSRKRTDRKVGHYKSKNAVRRRKNVQILHQSTW
jgi:Helix-hairpin-helix motif